MSKQSNPTLIGAFVVAAVALVALAVSLFGGRELLQAKLYYVTYFDSSVKGLRVGSNVLFRGVRVGYVTDISLVGDAETLEFVTPVTLELFPDALEITRDGKLVGDEERETLRMDDMIDAGLRSQLGVESFVTGQLVVELDLHPEMEPVYRGLNPPHPEIPSIASNIQLIFSNLQSWFSEFSESIDVQKLGADVQSLVDGVDKLVNSPELQQTLAGLNRLVNAEDTQALPGELRGSIDAFRAAVADTRSLVRNVDEGLEPIVENLGTSLNKLDSTLAAGEDALRMATEQLQGDSELAVELNDTLDEVKDAARSLRIFLDYLERNPEALLRGKRKAKD